MAKKSKFEMAVIDRVKAMRIKLELSQRDIAAIIDVSHGFVSHIESPNYVSSYNLDQLNKLAKAWNCSPRDFIPEKPL